MSNTTVTLLVAAGAGVLSLVAYCAWVVVPAWGAFGRVWERLAAVALSVYVLVSFVGLGVAAGVAAIVLWSRWA